MLHSKQAPVYSTSLQQHLRNLFFMLLGSLIYNAGFLTFVQPNELLSGGLWGISAIFNYFSGIPVGVFLLILNVPLILWGWSKLALRFALYTVFVIVFQSVMLIVMEPFFPTYTADHLLACIFGGAVMGLGSGLIVRYNGSGGGMDIVGIILKDKFDISVGTVLMISNFVIVGCAAFVFGLEPAMYTMVLLFITSMVFNQILEGFNRKRNMMIISEHGTEVAQRLIRQVGRGVTILKGEGAYTHRSKDVLFCVVSRFELSPIKEIIKELDPSAFVCINETYEVMGTFSELGRENLSVQMRELTAEEPTAPSPSRAGDAAGRPLDLLVVGGKPEENAALAAQLREGQPGAESDDK